MKKFLISIQSIYTVFLFVVYSIAIYIYTAFIFYDNFGIFGAIISLFFPFFSTIFMFLIQIIGFGFSSGFVQSVLYYLIAWLIYFLLIYVIEYLDKSRNFK